jgi:putative sugar O-methyltransferase
MITKKYKNFLKQIIPPIFLPIARKALAGFRENTDFKIWWASFNKERLPSELVSMIDTYIKTSDYHFTSRYWFWLNKRSINSISLNGIKNFRKTISRRYFLWLKYDEELIRKLFTLKLRNSPENQVLKKQNDIDILESVTHNVLIIALYNFICNLGIEKYLANIRESGTFDHPFIELDGEHLSQDKLNSLLEWHFINTAGGFESSKTVLEVGAGSGRTAACFLSLKPDIKYIIADIPPAQFVSFGYLSDLFPEKKIFICPMFYDYQKIKNQFESSDIIFMLPSQLSLLPASSVDLFLAIDCLHEMLPKQIDYLFEQVQRLAKYFYMKCWESTEVPFDNFILAENSYPYRSNWNVLKRDECVFPSNFFEVLFKIE